MHFTVVSLGGALAPEGEQIIRDAGGRCVATEPYPSQQAVTALLAETRAEAVVVRLVERVDGDVMRASPALKVVAKHGAGTNDIDLDAAEALGIPVLAAVGANAHSVAEHALALMLALAKDLRNQDAYVRGGGWDKKGYGGRELRGGRLGLVGAGAIGRTLAAMAAPLGMDATAFDPYAPDEAFGPAMTRAASLDELLSSSDVVSLHCPLTEATRGLIGAREIGLMKSTAFLVNTARGEVVDEAALLAALSQGRIAGAGLDSFAAEPPGAENPLWRLPNVIVSPHCGGVTPEARREVSLMTARNVVDLLAGREVHPRFRARR